MIIYINLVLCVVMPFVSAVHYKDGDIAIGSLCLVGAALNALSVYFALSA